MGSELEGTKALNGSKSDNQTPTLDNRNVTDIAQGASYKTNPSGLLNPATSSGHTLLDDAVGELSKKKPKVPHIGV